MKYQQVKISTDFYWILSNLSNCNKAISCAWLLQYILNFFWCPALIRVPGAVIILTATFARGWYLFCFISVEKKMTRKWRMIFLMGYIKWIVSYECYPFLWIWNRILWWLVYFYNVICTVSRPNRVHYKYPFYMLTLLYVQAFLNPQNFTAEGCFFSLF